MTRDYSRFLPPAGVSAPARAPLQSLGWQHFFAQQTSIETIAETPPVRVVEVHRNGLHVRGDRVDALIPPGPSATVGDWLLYDADRPAASRVLQRKSLFKRRAPGTGRDVQLIAANVDTAFVVSSCNQDFNVARLERYIALAFEADVTPVVVLTKTDLCADISAYVAAAVAISDRVAVVALDATGAEPADKLADWCRPGQTVVFLGSSGVGKSTLINALCGADDIATGAIREDDAKGRHTTTRRQLHVTPQGCAVLDTPGMRELQLADAGQGIADVFADLADLAARCRFGDCSHETEPGCAILEALDKGTIDPSRLARWRKLAAEDRFNSATLAERRAKDKAFGRMVRAVMDHKRQSRR